MSEEMGNWAVHDFLNNVFHEGYKTREDALRRAREILEETNDDARDSGNGYADEDMSGGIKVIKITDKSQFVTDSKNEHGDEFGHIEMFVVKEEKGDGGDD